MLLLPPPLSCASVDPLLQKVYVAKQTLLVLSRQGGILKKGIKAFKGLCLDKISPIAKLYYNFYIRRTVL